MPIRASKSEERKLFYGWHVLAALAFTQVTTWGVLYYSFSVFIDPMSRELGWSRSELTGAFSLALLSSALFGLVVGRWVDRYGPRLLMTTGSIVAAVAMAAWSRIDGLFWFYVLAIGLGAAMACTLYEPAFAAVATWFRRGRNRALTILTFVGGLASVLYLPLTALLVERYGWREALVILAVLTIPPHALVLRHRPADLGLEPDGAVNFGEVRVEASLAKPDDVSVDEAIHSATFRWLTVGFCLAFLANVAVTVHLVPYLIDRGYSTGSAATWAGMIGLLALPGRLIFTPLGSWIPRQLIAAAIFATQAAGLIVLILIRGQVGVLLFVVLFGLGFGAITPARAGLVADLYGSANYGSISSVLALFITVARAVAPVATGLLYVWFNGYGPVLWILAGIAAAGAFAVLRIGSGGAEVKLNS